MSDLKHGNFASEYKRGYEDVDTFMGCPEGIAEPVSEVAQLGEWPSGSFWIRQRLLISESPVWSSSLEVRLKSVGTQNKESCNNTKGRGALGMDKWVLEKQHLRTNGGMGVKYYFRCFHTCLTQNGALPTKLSQLFINWCSLESYPRIPVSPPFTHLQLRLLHSTLVLS